MSENINTNATFGQTDGDKEEEPIIVAQRFLNIFRQLHIFSNERREAFNQMILELPLSIRNMFKTLPGGSVLQEYVNELEKEHALEQSGKGSSSASPKTNSSTNILQNALSENQAQQNAAPAAGKSEIINSDNFAKILANSLAQSNAQIIRELQNNRPTSNASKQAPSLPAAAEPLKLVADETFTQTIASALADAIANSEQKRQEDNKVIAQSFLELQENLNKMMEQNTQLKIISSSDAPAEAASAFQLKNVVDDMVKAQSKFLKETTQSQKEELSSIISVAIKESLKLSTQSLIDSFKKMEDGDGPAPITYAASSPKKQMSMENVEEALKAQGREFSSIIASALRESQQNSAQAIIRTIESLKGTAAGGGGNAPKVEDIMKMQADLFRDIARAQNQEFSNLIASALQESQKQSTQAIIAALGQMQGRPVSYAPQPAPSFWPAPTPAPADPAFFDNMSSGGEQPASLEPEPIITPDKDYTLTEPAEESAVETDTAGSKKKKKKKKKNRGNDAENTAAANDTTPILAKPIQKKKTIISALPEMPVIEDKPQDTASDWGFGDYTSSAQENAVLQNPVSGAETETEAPAKTTEDQDWNWEYQPEEGETADASLSEDGEGWEWEYEEVPEDEAVEGEEGEDWEWEYEEVPEDEAGQAYEFEDPDADMPHFQEDFVEASEIIIPDNFELLLTGMEDADYQDPYLENNDNIG